MDDKMNTLNGYDYSDRDDPRVLLSMWTARRAGIARRSEAEVPSRQAIDQPREMLAVVGARLDDAVRRR